MNIRGLTSRCWGFIRESWDWSLEKIGSEWIAAVPSFLSMYAPEMYVYVHDEGREPDAQKPDKPTSDQDESSLTMSDQGDMRRSLRIVRSEPKSDRAADNT